MFLFFINELSHSLTAASINEMYCPTKQYRIANVRSSDSQCDDTTVLDETPIEPIYYSQASIVNYITTLDKLWTKYIHISDIGLTNHPHGRTWACPAESILVKTYFTCCFDFTSWHPCKKVDIVIARMSHECLGITFQRPLNYVLKCLIRMTTNTPSNLYIADPFFWGIHQGHQRGQ